jgi:class 3 adenylate cyclase
MTAVAHTFLFTDLVGFTALAAAEGDDRAAEVAVTLRQRVRRLLPAHRAEEVKAIGDGLMLRCDDAALGVRLGVSIVRDLEDAGGFPPVRVGIHSGPAVSRGGDWYGTTVNVAARLCAAASGGEVLVSEGTLRAAGSVPRVELGEHRLHWLKNVVEPVSARVAYERRCSEGRLNGLKALIRARPQEALS